MLLVAVICFVLFCVFVFYSNFKGWKYRDFNGSWDIKYFRN